jgi:hypothetical protein
MLRVWEQLVVVNSKALSIYLRRKTDENHKRHQSGYLITRQNLILHLSNRRPDSSVGITTDSR